MGGGELASFRLDGRHAAITDDLRWGFRARAGYARSETWDRSRTNVGDLEAEYREAVDGSVVINSRYSSAERW